MSDLKIPKHNLTFNETEFLTLLKSTNKFSQVQKEKVVENIALMKQWQIDELIEDLKKWSKEEVLTPKFEYTKTENGVNPQNIFNYLDERVIGQEAPKKKLSLAFYEHQIIEKTDEEYLKPNLLLIGPTGSGKTFMVSLLSKFLDRPFISANAAGMVSAGYVGTRLDEILTMLYLKADRNVKKAESGIILIDEFDKMVDGGSHASVGGAELQQEFLKLVEGGAHLCKSSFSRDANKIEIKTDNILFLFAGAFVGLKDIVEKRMNTKQIGFNGHQEATDDTIFQSVIHNDLIKYGVIPELVSRIQTIVPLKQLSSNDLYEILQNKYNPYINSLNKFFEYHNNNIRFEDEALHTISEHAWRKKLGARGLRGSIERVTYHLKFDSASSRDREYLITKEDVEKILNESK